MSKNSDKSYNQAMSEWAEQQASFLRKGRGAFLHPPHTAGPWGRAWGYTWRVLLVLILTGGAYVEILRRHCRSEDFVKMIEHQFKGLLKAETVKTATLQWKLNGALTASRIEATGGSGSIFNKLLAKDVQLAVPVPDIFRSGWDVSSAKILSLNMDLRSGASGSAGAGGPAVTPPPGASGIRTGSVRHQPRVFTAGWGVNPDFNQMTIRVCDLASASVSWGVTAPGQGAVSKVVSRLVNQGDGNWDISMTSGGMQLGWIDLMDISHGHLSLAPGKLTVHDLDLVPDPQQLLLKAPSRRSAADIDQPSVKIAGSVTTGDVPVLDLTAKVNAMPLHYFIPRDAAHDALWRLFEATVSGESTIRGSINRSSEVGTSDRSRLEAGLVPGVEIDSRFNILGGTILNLPLISALGGAAGREEMKSLKISGGRLHFRYGGSPVGRDGIAIEIKEVELETELCRISAQFNYQRDPVAGSPVGTVSLGSTISVGLKKPVADSIHPSILQQLGAAEHDGLIWIHTGKLGGNGSKLTTEIADSIVQMSQQLKDQPR